MSHLRVSRFHVNGEPIFHGPGAFGRSFQSVILTNPNPRFPPRQRAQEVKFTAPAPSAQPPPTRPVAAARQMPPPAAISRSDYPSRRPVAQSTALPSPPADVLPLPASALPSDGPATFEDELSVAAQAGSDRWLASGPSCKVPADQVAPPRADATDAWHNTSVMLYYPRPESFNTGVPIAITFVPTHGPGLEGVAMTELARGRGVLDPDAPIGDFFFLPEFIWAGAMGRLVFEWPGYYNVRTYRLVLQDDNGRYAPRAAFGSQIASAVNSFVENFGDSDPFKPGRHRMRLGAHGIRYEQLRLLEAISFNGQDFYLRLAAVIT